METYDRPVVNITSRRGGRTVPGHCETSCRTSRSSAVDRFLYCVVVDTCQVCVREYVSTWVREYVRAYVHTWVGARARARKKRSCRPRDESGTRDRYRCGSIEFEGLTAVAGVARRLAHRRGRVRPGSDCRQRCRVQRRRCSAMVGRLTWKNKRMGARRTDASRFRSLITAVSHIVHPLASAVSLRGGGGRPRCFADDPTRRLAREVIGPWRRAHACAFARHLNARAARAVPQRRNWFLFDDAAAPPDADAFSSPRGDQLRIRVHGALVNLFASRVHGTCMNIHRVVPLFIDRFHARITKRIFSIKWLSFR